MAIRARLAVAAAVFSTLARVSGGEPAVGTERPAYRAGQAVTGDLRLPASGVMTRLIQAAAEEFVTIQPGAKFQVSFPSSAGVLESLGDGRARLGAMSRPLTEPERLRIQRTFGHSALEFPVAQDALVIVVNRLNPVSGLTLDQLDAIFSSAALRSGSPATTWGDVGMTGSWQSEPIEPWGGAPGWGTTLTFESLVCWGALSGSFVQQANIERGIPEVVGDHLGAIGYTTLGSEGESTRTVPVAESAAGPFVPCEARTLENGSYPLRRLLYLYLVPKADGSLGALETEFLRFLLSADGQRIVAASGLVPIGEGQLRETRKQLPPP